MRYFTWNLELVSDILWMIVGYLDFSEDEIPKLIRALKHIDIIVFPLQWLKDVTISLLKLSASFFISKFN